VDDDADVVRIGGVYIMSGPRNTTVADGGTTRLDCDVDAVPDNVSVSWTLDGIVVASSSSSSSSSSTWPDTEETHLGQQRYR